MGTKHLELIVETQPGADLEQLKFQLKREDVETLPMGSGLLISGDVGALRAIIPTLKGDEPGEVAVPGHLNDVVKAINVFKPRTLM